MTYYLTPEQARRFGIEHILDKNGKLLGTRKAGQPLPLQYEGGTVQSNSNKTDRFILKGDKMAENPYIDEMAQFLIDDAIEGIEFMSAVEMAYDNPDWNMSEEDIEKAHARAIKGEGRPEMSDLSQEFLDSVLEENERLRAKVYMLTVGSPQLSEQEKEIRNKFLDNRGE